MSATAKLPVSGATAPGPFIVFEGLDGAGTTTQMGLLHTWMEETYRRRVYVTREPSSGPVGALIQQALKKRLSLDRRALALLFAADRLDHLETEILPWINRGVPTLCDRYTLSSLAYQWSDMPDGLDWIRQINAHAIRPDLTLFIDVPPEVCMERIRKARWQTELFEYIERLNMVRELYIRLIEDPLEAEERIVVIDGNRSLQEVHENIRVLVGDMMPAAAR